MSQFQNQTHMNSPVSTLDFHNIMEVQRHALKDLPSTMSDCKLTNSASTSKIDKSDDLSSGDEEEWISNWQFERIGPDKKTEGITSATNEPLQSKLSTPSVDNEGGVFYFERIQPSPEAPAISSNPSVISTSDTNVAVAPQASSSSTDIGDDNQKHDFDQHDFFLMTIDNDDLFADLEAAADSNDDSEISLDDLMDMDVDDDQHVNDHDDNFMRSLNTSQNSGLHDVNAFLNKSTSSASAALMNDDDFEMLENDDDNAYSFSSPITSKDTISSSLPFLSNTNSPTSVAHHMPSPPLLPSACSMSSASTRPALQKMRKMMTDLMDNGTMPRARHDSRLPCAEGMDEMYLDTLRKLSASMERSKKSRKSLSIPMQTMQSSTHYSRSMCVNQILQSVQTSSRHVDTCLRSVSMLSR